MPGTVTIPAGQQLTQVTATINTFSEEEEGVISATDATGTLKSATFAQVATTRLSTLGGVTAAVGNGNALIFWSALPESAFQVPIGTSNGNNRYVGYRVTRLQSDGQAAVVQGALFKGGLVHDYGIPAGVSVQYRVELLNGSQVAVIASTSMSSAQASSAPSLTHSVPPAVSGGRITGKVTPSVNANFLGWVFVNGELVGSTRSQYRFATPTFTTAYSVEDELVRGEAASYSVTIVGFINQQIVASAPAVVTQVTGGFSDFQPIEILDPNRSEVARLSYRVPLDSGTSWNLEIRTAGNILTKSWTGTGTRAIVEWDGKDSTGSYVADGEYSAILTYESGGSITKNSKGIKVFRGSPQFLGLVVQVVEDSAGSDQTKDLESDIVTYCAYINEKLSVQTPNLSRGIFGFRAEDELSKKARLKIRKWMKTSVRDFYYYGHAGGVTFDAGGLRFDAEEMYKDGLPLSAKAQDKIIAIDSLTALRGGTNSWNAIVLDGCNTCAGFKFREAFGITIDSGAFVGWTDLSGNFRDGFRGLTFPSGRETEWLYFWLEFWKQISLGYHVTQAATRAIDLYTRNTYQDPTFRPSSPGRLYQNGGYTFFGE